MPGPSPAVFEDTKHLVQSAVDGYNVCIFAYGQTGSGKTHTIYGSDNQPGLCPRGVSELFDIIDRDAGKFSFDVKVQMLELYQDTLIDLLLPPPPKPKFPGELYQDTPIDLPPLVIPPPWGPCLCDPDPVPRIRESGRR